jgi:hypothetical protein
MANRGLREMVWQRFTVIGLGILLSIIISPSSRANSITTFQLDHVTFFDGGSATGTFVFDTTNPVPEFWSAVSVDVTTTAGSQFSGAHYVTGGPGGLITGTALYGQTTYNVNAILWQATNPLSVFLLNIPLPDYPIEQISLVSPTALVATSAYPGEMFGPLFRVLASGSIDPIQTVIVEPPPKVTPPNLDVPEPATSSLFPIGLVGLVTWRRRKRRN